MAQVTVDVAAKVATAQLNRSITEIHRRIENAGRDAGDGFGSNFGNAVERATQRANKALGGTTKETDRLRSATEKYKAALSSGDVEKIIGAQNRLGKVYRDNATQAERFAKSQANLHSAIAGGGLNRQVSGLNDQIQSLGQNFTGLSRAAHPAMFAALVPAVGALAGVAAQATGAIGLLPGVLGTAAAGFGTFKLATMGVSEALESMSDPQKFAEAISKLSPNAQQAVMSIKAMIPAFNELKAATQNSFFEGLGPQLTKSVNALMPQIQSLTTGVATGLNGMLSGVLGQIASPEGMATLSATVSNVVRAFQNLAPAAAPATQAIMQLVNVGSSFLPDIATAVSDGAKAFSDFIAEASRTGELQGWIQSGINAATELGPIVLDLTKTFLALAPVGERVLPLIGDTLGIIADIMPPIASVTAEMSPLFATWEVAVSAVGGAFDIVSAAADAAIGVINNVSSAINAMAGGVNAAIEAANALSGMSIPEIPVIPMIGQTGQAPSQGGLPGASRERRGGAPVAGPNIPGGSPAPSPFWNQPDTRWGSDPTERLWRERDERLSGGGGGSGATGPEVPFSGDPMQLIQGLPVTSSLYSAAQSVLESRHKVEQEQAELNELLQSNTRNESEIQKARNELLIAQQESQQAELRLNEAKASSTEKFANQMQSASSSLRDFSIGLENDLGISNGLGGILSNIVKFIAGIASAPLMGPLQAIASTKDPAYGSGLAGLISAPFVTPSESYGTAQGYTQQGYGSSGYPGDAALLANVPRGIYTQDRRGDLTQGLADCSSAVEDLVNLLDGRPTGGASMSTHNAAQWLQSRGFLPGMGGPGDMRVGFNSGHMQATLPGGTNFNWGSDAAAARGGVGGTGAYDPAFTDHYYRPTAASSPFPSASPYASPPLYSPQNTSPGLTAPMNLSSGPAGPLPQGIGGAGGLPGTGFPQSGGPIDYGPAKSYNETRGWTPNSSGGIGIGGGLMGMAAGAGDLAMPGAGMAAQLAMAAISKGTEFGSKMAGHLGDGIMETWLSVGGASPASGWLGRALGALSGVGADVGNVAGKTAKEEPREPLANNTNTDNRNSNNTYNVHVKEQKSGREIANELAWKSYSSQYGR